MLGNGHEVSWANHRHSMSAASTTCSLIMRMRLLNRKRSPANDLSNIWMHAEHLIVDQKKMSKSLGNFYTLRDLLKKGYTGPQVRYMLLQTHYKTQLNFTFAGLDAVKGSLERLQDFIYRLHEIRSDTASGLVDPLLTEATKNFRQSLGDDLNISSALAALFDLVRHINALCDANRVSRQEAGKTIQMLKEFNQVLGVLNFEPAQPQIPKELQDALAQRIEARKQKNWALADSLRDFISSRGYSIEDGANGARLKKN